MNDTAAHPALARSAQETGAGRSAATALASVNRWHAGCIARDALGAHKEASLFHNQHESKVP